MKNKFINASLIAIALTAITFTSFATVIKVDVGLSGQQVQVGFEELSAGLSDTNASTILSNGIGLTLEGFGAAKGFRDRGDVTEVFGDLAEDFFHAADSIKVTLTGLAAGTYIFTSWHHDSDYTQSSANIDVSGNMLASNILATTGKIPSSIGSRNFYFTSTGTGTDIISFIEQNSVRNGVSSVILSGFSVESVPEPAALALMGLGLLGLCLSRRRKIL